MSLSRPPTRPINRLLVANRGEISTRIISSARELGIDTFAVFASGDSSHTLGATHSVKLTSSAAFLDIEELLKIVKEHRIDAIHPGYGFLSESADFALRMWEDAAAVVIGPGWETLSRTGDKIRARLLANECGVPICPALETPTDNVSDVRAFINKVAYPIMIKAVDGGGGRGIRLVRNEEVLENAFKRAVEESPSRQVFAEKAAVDGFRHIEVQIIGDGHGKAYHLWERECSIQRRFQKVVEIAPSNCEDRELVSNIIEDALLMAKKIHYFSLGTFEFLANPVTKKYFFLEINPRLQVEHTISESITGVDIVRSQLLLSQGLPLDRIELPHFNSSSAMLPALKSIQLRITAENVMNDWSLSIGKIQSFRFPTGNGIRVDTNLTSEHTYTVGSDYDSLIAKVIVTSSSWDGLVAKALRALEDTSIKGIQTNIAMLRAIVNHSDFRAKDCDTTWLEESRVDLLAAAERLPSASQTTPDSQDSSQAASLVSAPTSILFRKGDTWSANFVALDSKKGSVEETPVPHIFQLSRIMRNQFPESLVAEALWTAPGSKGPQPYTLNLKSTNATMLSQTSDHRRGVASDPSHVIIPFPGKLVEVAIEEGDVVKKGDVVCVVQQMKMELEVRALKGGRVSWVLDVDDGDQVAEGTLAAIIENIQSGQVKL